MSSDRASAGVFMPSWLCPRPVERSRLFELDARLGALGNIAQVLIPLSLVVSAVWLGPWVLLPLIFPVPLFVAMPWLIRRVRQPEWLLLAGILGLGCSLAVSIAMTGGLRSPLVPWAVFIWPGVNARFNRRAGALIIVVISVLMAGAVLVAPPRPPAPAAAVLVCLLAAVVTTAYYTGVLSRAESDQRAAATIDPLTGLLSRAALATRFDDLRREAVQHRWPLSVVVCDIDHFKRVNDTWGHDRGDTVLRAAAATLELGARSSDLLCRFGGEEFILVLPGVPTGEAVEVAERLRAAVAQAEPGGLPVTASFGVSCAYGADIDFAALFRAADAALYRAKAAGRNQVAADAGAEGADPAQAGRPEPVNPR
ncbi:diguanylate cyclase [Actinoplanes sp. NPDC020271]|uniref:diguanylate cyclase n=1 Tax=Actinoplanes sp. NPDC020271 TaxID=3363896 RepID=UPI003788FD2D